MSYRCNARTKTCTCGHRYTKEEYELWKCPECGKDRHCRQLVSREGERCRFHGGKSLKGIASPRYKHGRYTSLPPELAERYQESLSDEDLLALRDEIALVDARLHDLLSALGIGTTSELWKNLQDAYKNMRIALTQRDPDKANAALQTLGQAVENGVTQTSAWAEVYDVLDSRRRLVESERKRLVQMHQFITAEQAMALLARVQQSILENVKDKHALAAIATDLAELVSERTR
ncbi:hypothetical protein GF380_01870 [Candidatus Uhrbacteria bacterium]|nr:hypothetical protein [Candidatus Uhrbacteria bacterium]